MRIVKKFRSECFLSYCVHRGAEVRDSFDQWFSELSIDGPVVIPVPSARVKSGKDKRRTAPPVPGRLYKRRSEVSMYNEN